MGKKKVINECQGCAAYQEIALHRWQEQKEKALTEVKEVLQAGVVDEQHQIELFETIYAYCSNDEVLKFEKVIESKYPQHTRLRSKIREKLLVLGHSEEAIANLQARASLNPEDANATYLLGWSLFDQGEYEQAKNELTKVHPIKTRQDYGKLVKLAQKLSGKSKYEVIRLIKQYEQKLFDKHDQLNKWAIACELQLGVPKDKSIVAPGYAKNKKKEVIIAVSVVLLLLTVATTFLLYKYHHTKVYIVNGYQQELDLNLPGLADFSLAANEAALLEVSPDHYTLTVSGPLGQSMIELEVVVPWEDLVFRDPLYVVNPGGAAILYLNEVIYSVNPYGGEGDFKIYREEQVYFNAIDYPFTEAPDEISMNSKSESRNELGFYQNEPIGVIHFLMEYDQVYGDTLTLAYMEAQMAAGYQNEQFSRLYDSLLLSQY